MRDDEDCLEVLDILLELKLVVELEVVELDVLELVELLEDELDVVLDELLEDELELKVDKLLDELDVEELLEVELDELLVVVELDVDELELLELLEIMLDELLDDVELEPEVDTLSGSFLSAQPVKIAEIAKIPAASLILFIIFLPNCIFVIL